MPCRGPDQDEITRGEMDRAVKDAVENAHVHILESEAGDLRKWLESQLNTHDGSETAKLCALVRSLGENVVIQFCAKRAWDTSEARRLLGWWERHKEIDKSEGR